MFLGRGYFGYFSFHSVHGTCAAVWVRASAPWLPYGPSWLRAWQNWNSSCRGVHLIYSLMNGMDYACNLVYDR